MAAALSPQRDYELKQAEFDIEVETRKADADLAAKLQQAIVQQKIVRCTPSMPNAQDPLCHFCLWSTSSIPSGGTRLLLFRLRPDRTRS